MSSLSERPGTVPPRDAPAQTMPPWIPRVILLVALAVAGFMVAWWAVHRLRDLLVILLVSMFLSLAIEPGVNLLAARSPKLGHALAAAVNPGRPTRS